MLDMGVLWGYNRCNLKIRKEIALDQIKLDRINELARISKTRALTDEEKAEQKALREEYIIAYRASLRGILDNTVIRRPDGSEEKLKKQ